MASIYPTPLFLSFPSTSPWLSYLSCSILAVWSILYVFIYLVYLIYPVYHIYRIYLAYITYLVFSYHIPDILQRSWRAEVSNKLCAYRRSTVLVGHLFSSFSSLGISCPFFSFCFSSSFSFSFSSSFSSSVLSLFLFLFLFSFTPFSLSLSPSSPFSVFPFLCLFLFSSLLFSFSFFFLSLSPSRLLYFSCLLFSLHMIYLSISLFAPDLAKVLCLPRNLYLTLPNCCAYRKICTWPCEKAAPATKSVLDLAEVMCLSRYLRLRVRKSRDEIRAMLLLSRILAVACRSAATATQFNPGENLVWPCHWTFQPRGDPVVTPRRPIASPCARLPFACFACG